jgi:hypothetical protein
MHISLSFISKMSISDPYLAFCQNVKKDGGVKYSRSRYTLSLHYTILLDLYVSAAKPLSDLASKLFSMGLTYFVYLDSSTLYNNLIICMYIFCHGE